MDEQTLLAALRRRDPAAFSQLFETHSDKIYRLAVGLLQDESAAEGVVQDTFMRLIERLDQFEGRAKLSTWLYRVAYNLCQDRLREKRPLFPLSNNQDDDTLPTPTIFSVDFAGGKALFGQRLPVDEDGGDGEGVVIVLVVAEGEQRPFFSQSVLT